MRLVVAFLFLLAVLAAASSLGASRSIEGGGEAPRQARELGQVSWQRDFDAALAEAREAGKPVFVLFQEVPGCSTCVTFGEAVLSHPLLVEAVESAFVPVAVLNNEPGPDREVLKRYDEPAWNNPVVRFLDAEGRDLIPRAAGVWTPHGIATRMVRALEVADRPVPGYLELAVYETAPRRTGRALFATHCFWEGEACAGALPGVVSTEAAWLGGREIVEVTYDAGATSYEGLLVALQGRGCADAIFARDARELASARRVFGAAALEAPGEPRRARESDQDRHLRRSALASLELTPLQRTRVNSALGLGRDPLRWLSPRQRARLRDS